MSVTIDNVEVTEEQLGGVITAQRGHTQALAFAYKGGKGLSTVLHGVWVAKAAERQGKLAVFVYLLNNYSDDERAAIPVVGSKKGETGNKPYDRYTTKVKDGSGEKAVPGSWYTDAVRSTEEYKWTDAVILYCDDAHDGSVPDMSRLGPEWNGVQPKTTKAHELRDLMKKAQADMRAGLVAGCKLFLHSETIAAINPERIVVKMPIRKDAQSEELVLGGSNTVKLEDPMQGGEDTRYLSVSEFLNLDPEKLQGEGKAQTLTTLMATKDRAPRGKGKTKGGAASTIPLPKNVNDLITMANLFSTAIDNGTDEGQKLEAMLLERLASKSDNGGEAVDAIGKLALSLDNIWTIIGARYNERNAQRARAMNEKAQAERQARTSH